MACFVAIDADGNFGLVVTIVPRFRVSDSVFEIWSLVIYSLLLLFQRFLPFRIATTVVSAQLTNSSLQCELPCRIALLLKHEARKPDSDTSPRTLCTAGRWSVSRVCITGMVRTAGYEGLDDGGVGGRCATRGHTVPVRMVCLQIAVLVPGILHPATRILR